MRIHRVMLLVDWQAGDGAETGASEIKLKWTKLRPSGAVPSTRTGAVMVARPQTTMVRTQTLPDG